jgi:hypothetical protein
MVKSAAEWRLHNAANGMYCSRRRRILVDRQVRPSLIVVDRVRAKQMAKMPLADHDNMVQAIASG